MEGGWERRVSGEREWSMSQPRKHLSALTAQKHWWVNQLEPQEAARPGHQTAVAAAFSFHLLAGVEKAHVTEESP